LMVCGSFFILPGSQGRFLDAGYPEPACASHAGATSYPPNII
jgi:hypothetical protein